MRKFWLILALVLFGAIASVGQNTQTVKPFNVFDHIVSPDSVVYSRTFSEWDAEWQQWAYSIDVTHHPLFDNAECTKNQSGMVRFLGGKFCNNTDQNCGHYNNIQRSCTVPRGKYLYFPIDNGEDSALEENIAEHPGDINYQQIGYMRQGWDPWAGTPPTEYAIIDGVEVPHLERFAVQSVVFGFTIPDDNYLKAVYAPPYNDFPAGAYYPAVDDGRYLMLAPLPPGKHTIQFGANWSGWGFGITYFITVPK